MFFLITSVFISAASAAVQFECSTVSSSAIANEMGLESGSWMADFHRWDGGKVPYYFSNRVTQQDKMFLKKQMEIIESKTCVRFIEHSQFPIPSHHMKIDIGPESCAESRGFGQWARFHAGVKTGQNGLEVLFESKYQFVDQSVCLEHIGRGVIHELFHVLGAIHTHKRMDRDDYITYNRWCLRDQSFVTRSQFDKEEFPLPTDTEEIKYEFASIMHYGCDTLSKCQGGGCQCNTIEPKDGTPCSALGSNPLPTDTDWEMIRQWHCGADTRTTSKPDISTKQPLISTRQPNILVWPWNWWDSPWPQTPICTYMDYADPLLCAWGRKWCGSNDYIREECAATCNC